MRRERGGRELEEEEEEEEGEEEGRRCRRNFITHLSAFLFKRGDWGEGERESASPFWGGMQGVFAGGGAGLCRGGGNSRYKSQIDWAISLHPKKKGLVCVCVSRVKHTHSPSLCASVCVCVCVCVRCGALAPRLSKSAWWSRSRLGRSSGGTCT